MSTTNDTEHNGWTNFETWVIHTVGIDGAHDTQDFWLARAREAWSTSEHGGNDLAPNRSARARILLVPWLSEHFQAQASEDSMPPLPAVMVNLLTAALARVEWYEIADMLLEQLAELDERDDYQRQGTR